MQAQFLCYLLVFYSYAFYASDRAKEIKDVNVQTISIVNNSNSTMIIWVERNIRYAFERKSDFFSLELKQPVCRTQINGYVSRTHTAEEVIKPTENVTIEHIYIRHPLPGKANGNKYSPITKITYDLCIHNPITETTDMYELATPQNVKVYIKDPQVSETT